MLHYTTTLHPGLSFLLMKRRPKYLQQMFNDAQYIQHNIQACKKILNEELDVKKHDNEYEQKMVDLNLEQRVNDIICPLEFLNDNNFAKDYITLIGRENTNLALDSSHDNHEDDYFMYSLVEGQEDEFANQLVEEHADVPRFFLLDDTADVPDFPIYDEYNDDDDDEFL
jgi:hypothetical protein